MYHRSKHGNGITAPHGDDDDPPGQDINGLLAKDKRRRSALFFE
jgi:hypothetical protein